MQEKFEHLKALAFQLSALSAEILSVFAKEDCEKFAEAEELKKSPSRLTGLLIFRSAGDRYTQAVK